MNQSERDARELHLERGVGNDVGKVEDYCSCGHMDDSHEKERGRCVECMCEGFRKR